MSITPISSRKDPADDGTSALESERGQNTGSTVTPLRELRRRRVFRVAGIYLVGAWILAEASDVIFPALLLPDWTVTFVIVLLILAFPVAMLFAWIFDLGPDGIQRTESLHKTGEALHGPMAEIIYAGLLLLAMLVLAGVLLSPWQYFTDAPGGTRSSIAVLPFANMSGDRENNYFSDGMSEELLNLLAKVPGLQVAARTSSFGFRDTSLDVREVAQKLGVETVLEGSVRWSGDDQIRITAQLVDAETGYHLWSETYNERLSDIFAVQDRIAREIVAALEVTLGAEEATTLESAAARPTRDLQAYDHYLRGWDILRRGGMPGIQLALELFQAAVGRDPGFARAHAGVATTLVLLPDYSDADPADTYARASDAAVKALTLDASLGEAHAVLAQIHLAQWHWSDAETGFFAATGLDADEPTSYLWYGGMLMETGRLQSALDNLQIALRLDPDSPAIHGALASLQLLMGNDDEALRLVDEAERLGFARNLGGTRAVAYLRAGRQDDAARSLAASDTVGSIDLARAVVAAAAQPEALPDLVEMLAATPDLPPQAAFDLCTAFGLVDCAYEYLGHVPEGQRVRLASVWSAEGAAFRRDARFVDLVTRIGLVDYWRSYGWSDFCRESDGVVSCR